MLMSDWSSDVCSSDRLVVLGDVLFGPIGIGSLAIGIASLGFFWLAAGYDERSPWTVKQESDPQRDKKDAHVPDVPLTILWVRSEEHTSELQSLMRISYAVFCLKKKNEKRKQKYLANRIS